MTTPLDLADAVRALLATGPTCSYCDALATHAARYATACDAHAADLRLAYAGAGETAGAAVVRQALAALDAARSDAAELRKLRWCVAHERDGRAAKHVTWPALEAWLLAHGWQRHHAPDDWGGDYARDWQAWVNVPREPGGMADVIDNCGTGEPGSEYERERRDADGHFIAAARTDVPRLLAELARLRAVEAAAISACELEGGPGEDAALEGLRAALRGGQ